MNIKSENKKIGKYDFVFHMNLSECAIENMWTCNQHTHFNKTFYTHIYLVFDLHKPVTTPYHGEQNICTYIAQSKNAETQQMQIINFI